MRLLYVRRLLLGARLFDARCLLLGARLFDARAVSHSDRFWQNRDFRIYDFQWTFIFLSLYSPL